MKLERIALWAEQKLFAAQTDTKLGYEGSAKGYFEDGKLEMAPTLFLASVSAQYEYGVLLRFLRSEDGKFLFKDKTAMEVCCRESVLHHIPYSFSMECFGFRVLTEDYVWYIACTPWNEKRCVTVYGYDRVPLMTALAKEKGLPETCYGVLPFSGEQIKIRFGDYAYESFPQYGANRKKNEKEVANLNKPFKLSKAQVSAMAQGVIYGWDNPIADPANYDKDGYYLSEEDGGKKK